MFAHDCKTFARYASIGTQWTMEECLDFSLCFESMNMSDRSVWAFEKNVGFHQYFIIGFFYEKKVQANN